MNTIELNKDIAKAAKAVALDWPGVIEADDIQQELWVRVLESEKTLNAITNAEPALRMDLLKRMGVQVASKYANDYEVFTGNIFYSSAHVRRVLEAGLLTATRRDLAEMDETLTEFLDLHESFDVLKRINQEQAQAIWADFVEDNFDKSSPSARKKLSRAVNHLTDLMNQAYKRRMASYEDGPGSREVMSNARARAISSTQWEGKKDA